MKNSKYNSFNNSCQEFCINMSKELNPALNSLNNSDIKTASSLVFIVIFLSYIQKTFVYLLTIRIYNDLLIK